MTDGNNFHEHEFRLNRLDKDVGEIRNDVSCMKIKQTEHEVVLSSINRVFWVIATATITAIVVALIALILK